MNKIDVIHNRIEVECAYCKKPFLKKYRKSSNHPIRVRGARTVTCSKECSKKFATYRQKKYREITR